MISLFLLPTLLISALALVASASPSHTSVRQQPHLLTSTNSPLLLLSLSRQSSQRRPRCPKYRSLDGLCTSAATASCGDLTWGQAGKPFFSYLSAWSSVRPARTNQPSPRLISNVMSTQTSDIPSTCGLRELFVFFGEFLDHNLAGSQLNDADRLDIPIPPGDSLALNFSSGFLHFTRARRVAVPGEPSGTERAANLVSAAIDLSPVYGTSAQRLKELRTFTRGKLRMSRNGFMPLNKPGLENEPSHARKFFLAGDVRANDHPVLTSLHTVFAREHNFWCDRLASKYPGLSDEKLFQRARKINIAQMQKIVYEEFIPAMTGRPLQPYRGHDPCVNPSVSDIFASAAYRIGHTLVGNKVQRRGRGMTKLASLPFTSMFFNPAERFIKLGLESFVRGAFATRAQQVDTKVSSSLRNFLFANVDSPEFARLVDLISINVQRGRDNNLPGYNQLRTMFGMRRARKWAHVSSDLNTQTKLSTLYRSPDDVDPWVGLMAEDHVGKACMGKTVRNIWEKEFTRLRDGDSRFYLTRKYFSRRLLRDFSELRKIRKVGKQETLKKLIVRHTKIKKSELRGPIFKFK